VSGVAESTFDPSEFGFDESVAHHRSIRVVDVLLMITGTHRDLSITFAHRYESDAGDVKRFVTAPLTRLSGRARDHVIESIDDRVDRCDVFRIDGDRRDLDTWRRCSLAECGR